MSHMLIPLMYMHIHIYIKERERETEREKEIKTKLSSTWSHRNLKPVSQVNSNFPRNI